MDNDDHIEEHIFHIPNNDELDLVLYIDRRNNNEHLNKTFFIEIN
jgi:hypothetical protein